MHKIKVQPLHFKMPYLEANKIRLFWGKVSRCLHTVPKAQFLSENSKKEKKIHKKDNFEISTLTKKYSHWDFKFTKKCSHWDFKTYQKNAHFENSKFTKKMLTVKIQFCQKKWSIFTEHCSHSDLLSLFFPKYAQINIFEFTTFCQKMLT